MIYLLYGTQTYLIEEEINSIIKKENIMNFNIEKYDLETDSLKEIIDSITTISLFDEKKLLIVDNSFIFTGSNKKCDNIEILDNYLDNYNDNILIFKTDNEKLDSRKKIVTKIKKIGSVKEFNNNLNINDKIVELFKPYKIDNNLVRYFIDRVGNNLCIINEEIEKIKTYKNEDLIIIKDDIDNLTIKNINTDIFTLIDNILNNKKEEALESLHEMIKRGEEPIKIIVMLANQFRLIYQVKELYKKGYREYDIADLLDQKPYTIKKATERIGKYDSNELLKYINELSELDTNIKSGLIDKNIGLELFILKLKKS